MSKIRDIKINWQRLIFRLKRKIKLHRQESRRRDAVKEANRLKAVTGKQHRVLLLEGQYLVRSRRDLVNLNKLFARGSKHNYIDIDRFTVYTTK
jgi:hypothetical protein